MHRQNFNKIINRHHRIIFIVAGLLVFGYIAAITALRIPAVQKRLVRIAAGWLSEELNTEVRIMSLRFEPFSKLVLRGIYIADQDNDTLLYARVLKLNFRSIDLDKHYLNINTIELSDAVIRMVKADEDRSMNFDFIVEYFSRAPDDTSASAPWQIRAGKLSLMNIRFAFRDLKYNNPSEGVDFDDIEISRLFATFRDIYLFKDSLSFEMRELSFQEKSGFQLNRLSSSFVKLIPDSLCLENMLVETPQSRLKGRLAMGFEQLQDFDDFTERIQLNCDFEESVLHSEDLAYFAPELKGVNRSLTYSGQVAGTVNQLKLRQFALGYGEKTRFKGRINLNGLPDIHETFIDLIVEDLKISPADVATIPLPPFNNKQTIKVPEEIFRLGMIGFKGKFTGFFNDFVAYGNISTDLGYITTDINLKFKTIPEYSGKLSMDNFNLGGFLDSPELGSLSLNASVNGNYFDLNKVSLNIKGNISRLDFRNYPYSNMEISANLSRKMFNGLLMVNDANLDLGFKGSIDFTGKIPVMDFSADLNRANLSSLNLVKRDSATRLSFHTDIDLTGKSIDDIEGRIMINNIRYSEGANQVVLNHLTLTSAFLKNLRTIHLISEEAEASVAGNFELSSLIPAFQNMLQLHLPFAFLKTTTAVRQQELDYKAELKNIQPVLDVFLPELKIAQGTSLNGKFISSRNDFSIHLFTPGISWNKINFKKTELNGFTENDRFQFTLKSPDASFRDSLVFKNFRLQGSSSFKEAEFSLTTNGRDSLNDNFQTRGRLQFSQSGKTILQLEQTAITVEKQLWQLDPGNTIIIDSTGAQIMNLILHSGTEKLTVNGYAGPDPSQQLKLLFQKFPLNPLKKILMTYKITAGGTLDGELSLRELTTRPVIQSNLLITQFSLFGDTLGNAKFEVDFPVGMKKLTAAIDISRDDITNLRMNGTYNLAEDKFDVKAIFNKMNVAAFGHYLRSFASQVRGFASGEVTLGGSSQKPELRGKIKLQKAAMTIDYLNCRYSFSDEVTITPSAFSFTNITLTDSLGNTATLNGNIMHQHFSNFKLYLSVRTRNLLVLNTTEADNNLFYGTGFASGQMIIEGPFSMISFKGALRTEKGTEISIPLSKPDEITQSSFVSFFTTDTSKTTVTSSPVDLSGISLRLDLNITEEALVKLIYDEKIGDKMEGRGTGNIVFEISNDETFSMRGDYTATTGNYVFTLQNVINKRFYIQPGGTIRWNGSPYEAIIDFKAVYRTRASLYDLLQDTSATARRRIPVQIILSLRNRLLKPDISFNIDIPDIDPATQGLVSQAISTEESRSKQTLSLLVMNRFLPGDNRSTTFEASSSGFGANASELLSVQLTNWVSQLTDKVEVGINYRAGDKLNSDQLEVMLATRLFNDWVSVETNVGFTGSNQGNRQNNSNLVGDFNIDVKITEDGKFHFKAFNRSNNINFLTNFNSLYTQGIGFYYKQEFNSLKDIFGKRKEQ